MIFRPDCRQLCGFGWPALVGETALLTPDLCMASVVQFSGGSCSQGLTPFPLLPMLYTRLHCWLSYLHSDLGRGTSRPLVLYQDLLGGWGQGLLKVLFSVLTQDLSTPSPSFSSGPQVHKEAEAFCSGLLCREMIVCTAFI